MTNNEIYYNYHMDHIPQKFLDKAKIELFESPEAVQICTEDLKKLIREEESMKEEWFSDDVILMYLRCRKFRVREAFFSMKKMVAFIKKNSQYFHPIDTEVIDEILKTGFLGLLPRRDSEGHAIFVFRLGAWDTSKIKEKHFLHCGALLALNASSEPMTQINGAKIIADYNCNSLRYIRYITPFLILFWYNLILECIPIRAKAGHVLHPSMITKFVWTVVKSFVPEKFKNRLFIHDNPGDLLSCIQPNAVPKEYGGTLTKEEEVREVLAKTLVWPDYVTAIVEHSKATE